MVPSAVVNRHEWNTGLDESARQQQSLPKGIASIAIASFFRFFTDIERRLSRRRSHQIHALAIVIVESQRRVTSGSVAESRKCIDPLSKNRTVLEFVIRQALGKCNIANAEIGTVGIIRDNKWSVLRPQKIRATRPRHGRHREIGWQTVGLPEFMSSDRSHAGMKTYERTTTDGNPWWSPGHHVVISRSMIGLIMPDRPNQGELVGDAGKTSHVL